MTVRVIHAQPKHHEMARAFFKSRGIIATEADIRELAAVLAKIEDEAKEDMARAVQRLSAGDSFLNICHTLALEEDAYRKINWDEPTEEMLDYGDAVRRQDHDDAARIGH